jgi:hypothetical protein
MLLKYSRKARGCYAAGLVIGSNSGSVVHHFFAWLATFIGRPKRSMKPRAAVTS